VRGVEFDAVVAAGLEVRRRAAEGVDDHADLGGVHLVWRRRVSRRRDRGRPHRNRLGRPARRLTAEMGELAEDAGAVALDSVGPKPQRLDPVLVPGLDDDPYETSSSRARLRPR
jgi:hypothetical protein